MKKLITLVSVAVIFTVLTAVFLPSAVSVSADSDYSKNYTDYSGTYQGEKNWYYYSGNYENDSLIRMYYCSQGSYWQGQSYYNRIDVTLTQVPAGGYDAIRAYVVPRTCRISLSGNLMNYCGAGSNGAVAKIALRRVGNTDSGNDVVLFDETLLYSDENVSLSNVPSLQNIDVNAGDVLFFIVSDNGEDGNDFLCFEVVPVFEDVAAESAFSTAVAAESVDVRSGNYSIAIEGGILRPHDLFIPHMNPSDDYAYLEMAYGFTDTQANPSMGQSAGFVKMARDLTQDHKPYHIPDYTVEATAVQVAWGNQFFSNPYAGFTGLKFNVPSDGKMSVLGGATTTNEGISYIVCLIRNGTYTIVSQKDVAQSVIAYFDEDADINDFAVKAGDQVVYIACSATPHVCQSADIIFDYEAIAGTD
ncbi:MAG: hypothetical protein ACI4S9_07325, partial [Christensenellales bacterium]